MAKYVFKPYHPTFPKLFENEKQRLKKILGSEALIEHIGSTAVPGLGGKGIIDIAIAVPKNQMKNTQTVLEKNDYEYRPHAGDEERLFFQCDLKDEIEGARRYHLHLTFLDSNTWHRYLAFRNYLINHPEEKERYAEIKQKVAEQSNEDNQKYMQIKEPIIQDITQKAMKEYNSNSNPRCV